MVRFYSICVDAFPEIPALKQALKDFQRVDLICAGAFTTATMTSMISGTVGSRIIAGGIGYSTSYSPKFLAWRKNGKSLTDMVVNHGKNVVIHNNVPWMASNIVGTPLDKSQISQHYRDHHVIGEGEKKDFGVAMTKGNVIYTSSHPDNTLDTFIEWGAPERKKKFYENERKFFSSYQFEGLLWTDLCHWHEAVYYPRGNPFHDCSKNLPVLRENALEDSITWLESIDFNQPDSVFFIYADHSHKVASFLDLPGCLTWGYWKDNREKRASLRPVISSYDIYPLVLSVLGIPGAPTDILGESPFATWNPSRTYYVEDGRSGAADKTIATVFGKVQLVNGVYILVSHVMPKAAAPSGYYVTLAEKSNVHTFDVYYFDGSTCSRTRTTCPGPGLSESSVVSPKVQFPPAFGDIAIKLGLPGTYLGRS